MSLQGFQSMLFRLIAEPEFRDGIRAQKPFPPRVELSTREMRRLRAIADDRGLDINRTLHKGFRLGKLRALLPMTCQLLGSRRLSRELSRFWLERPPSSFSFLPEALDFCEFLKRRRLRMRYLHDVLAFERALLRLEAAGADGHPEAVAFEHDPAPVLAALAAGGRPRHVPRQRVDAVATRGQDGHIQWRMAPH